MLRNHLTSILRSKIDDPLIGFIEPFVFIKWRYISPSVYRNVPFVRNLRRQQGFTLVELLIVLALSAALLGIGVPNLRTFIQNSRVTTQSNEVIGDLATARSEAIKRNGRIVICRSSDPTETTPACATGGTGSWETGWLTFHDADGNNSFTTAGGDTLLTVHGPLTGDNTLRGNSTTLGDYVAYTRDGVTTLAAPAATAPAHHFKLCDSRGAAFARAIILDRSGRARIGRLSTFSSLTCP